MRPISITAAVLIKVLDVGAYLVWFGLWLYLLRYLVSLGDVLFPAAWIPAGIILAVFVGYVLRPVRKILFLAFTREIARSSLRPLMEVGVWELLRVAYRFWPQEPVTDFIGISALHQVYEESPARRREQLYAVVRRMESATGCPMAQAAHDFLDEIGVEADVR